MDKQVAMCMNLSGSVAIVPFIIVTQYMHAYSPAQALPGTERLELMGIDKPCWRPAAGRHRLKAVYTMVCNY